MSLFPSPLGHPFPGDHSPAAIREPTSIEPMPTFTPMQELAQRRAEAAQVAVVQAPAMDVSEDAKRVTIAGLLN